MLSCFGVVTVVEPYGEFLLDLSVPYERAVVLEIFNICEIDSSIEFSKFEYCEPGSAASFTPLKLVRFDTEIPDFSRAETRELRDLASMVAVTAGHTWDDIFHTAQKYCTIDPEVLEKVDIEKCLRELKVLDLNNVVSEVFFTLDPMQFGKANYVRYFFLYFYALVLILARFIRRSTTQPVFFTAFFSC